MLIRNKSVFIGSSFDEYKKIRNILKENNIICKLRTENSSNRWGLRGVTRDMGNFQIDNLQEIVYELLVAKKDVEKAEFIIRNYKENND